jgi:predicted exporter
MDLTRKKIFWWITKFSCVRHKYLILGTLILGGISAFLITRLQFQSDVLNLLLSNAPTTGAFVKFLKEFGAADSLLIVLERESGGEVESFAPFADLLAEELIKSGEFDERPARLDQAAREIMGQQLVCKALLYLTEDDLREMEAKLTDAAIRQHVRALKVRLQTPLGSFASQWAARDLLELWPLFQKHLPMGSMRGGIVSEGNLLSEDRKMMLLMAKPRGSASDVHYDEILSEKVQVAIATAKTAFLREKKIPGPDYFQDLRIGLTGGHSIALEDSRMIKRELMINFSVSLVGVLTLFVLGFRRRIAIFYSSFPLLVSPLLTLGLFSSSLGRLIESTGAFSAIVLGLSIDFIILLYSRLEARVQEKMGEGQETIVVLTGSHRPEEALEVQGLLRSKFEQAMAAGLPISRYENLSAFIPPPSQQKRNLEWIEKRASAILNPIRLEKKLVQALPEEGFRVETFQPGLNMLREMLANREMLTWEQLPGTPLQALGERFLKRDGTLFGLRLFSMLGGASGLTQEGRLSWKT